MSPLPLVASSKNWDEAYSEHLLREESRRTGQNIQDLRKRRVWFADDSACADAWMVGRAKDKWDRASMTKAIRPSGWGLRKHVFVMMQRRL